MSRLRVVVVGVGSIDFIVMSGLVIFVYLDLKYLVKCFVMVVFEMKILWVVFFKKVGEVSK